MNTLVAHRLRRQPRRAGGQVACRAEALNPAPHVETEFTRATAALQTTARTSPGRCQHPRRTPRVQVVDKQGRQAA
jgi:hypothetical protein